MPKSKKFWKEINNQINRLMDAEDSGDPAETIRVIQNLKRTLEKMEERVENESKNI